MIFNFFPGSDIQLNKEMTYVYYSMALFESIFFLTMLINCLVITIKIELQLSQICPVIFGIIYGANKSSIWIIHYYIAILFKQRINGILIYY